MGLDISVKLDDFVDDLSASNNVLSSERNLYYNPDHTKSKMTKCVSDEDK